MQNSDAYDYIASSGVQQLFADEWESLHAYVELMRAGIRKRYIPPRVVLEGTGDSIHSHIVQRPTEGEIEVIVHQVGFQREFHEFVEFLRSDERFCKEVANACPKHNKFVWTVAHAAFGKRFARRRLLASEAGDQSPD